MLRVSETSPFNASVSPKVANKRGQPIMISCGTLIDNWETVILTDLRSLRAGWMKLLELYGAADLVLQTHILKSPPVLNPVSTSPR